MRKILISLAAAALPLLGATAAHADGLGATPVTAPNAAIVAGTITSVDTGNGTFAADAFVVPPYDGGREFGGEGTDEATTGGAFTGPAEPTATPVTITTDANTKIMVEDRAATISDLVAGEHFRALFTGLPSDPITTLVANPALSIDAHPAPADRQLYAFVGTVTSTDATAGTLTVAVGGSLPSGLPATGVDATFTVGSSTLVLGDSSTSAFAAGSLSSIAPGDIVAGGRIGAAGMTAAQVEAQPLTLLLDFPASSSTTGASIMHVKAAALKRTVQLLGFRPLRRKSHKRHVHKHAKKK